MGKCKQMHGSDFQIFAPSDSPSKQENDQTNSYVDQDMWMIYQSLLFILYEQIKAAWSCELRRLVEDLVYD